MRGMLGSGKTLEAPFLLLGIALEVSQPVCWVLVRVRSAEAPETGPCGDVSILNNWFCMMGSSHFSSKFVRPLNIFICMAESAESARIHNYSACSQSSMN